MDEEILSGTQRKLEREWYVVFSPTDTKVKRWWHRFIPDENMRHVWAFTQEGNRVVFFNRLCTHLHFEVHDSFTVDTAVQCLRDLYQGYSILKVTTSIPVDETSVRYRGALYCVTVVKDLLGITSWSITPSQLYRYLLNNLNATKVL